MGLAAVWGVMTGCQPAPVGLGPFPAPAPAHPGGLRYYLARDFVVVEADVTEFVETRVASDGGTTLKEETVTGRFPTDVSVSLKTSSDPSRAFILDVAPRGASDQSMAVRVGDNGLLMSADFVSKDRAAELLVQIARVAGGAAGIAAGLGFRGGPAFDSESLSLEARYFLQESPGAGGLRGEVERLETELAERRKALRGLTDEAAAASESARYSLAEKRAEFLEGTIRFLENQAGQARAAFAAAVGRFVEAAGIGRTTRQRTVRRHLEVADLPPSAGLDGLEDESRVVAALEKRFARALDIYLETGLVVAFDPEQALPEIPAPAPAETVRKNEIRVYYREPVPGFLRIYSWTEAADPEAGRFRRAFVRLDEKHVFVIHPGTPVFSVGFDRKAFSSRNMQLLINGQGRVVGLSKSAASASAASAAAAAAALDSIRETVAETLEDVREVVEALRKLALGDLQAQVDLLKLQLEKLRKEAEIEAFRDGPESGPQGG